MCQQATEDQSHLFSCVESVRKMDRLVERTKELITKRLDNLDMYRILKDQTDKPSSSYLLYYLNHKSVFDCSFLSTVQARGIVTKELTNKFSQAKRLKANRDLWLHLTIDCWLSAFHEIVLKERCAAVEESNNIRINITCREQSNPDEKLSEDQDQLQTEDQDQ
jgi:hypothetical protein